MKKVLTVILSAVLFGALAGGVMLGVGKLGTSLNSSTQAAIEETTAAAEAQVQETQKAATEQETIVTASKSVSSEDSGSTIKKGEIIQGGVTAIDVSDVVEACMPEVVSITNTMVYKQQGYANFYDYFYGRGTEQEYTATASGSGVIIAEQGDELLIVTNKHVVEDATELEVTFIDGKTAKADLKGTGSDVDIAVIAIPLADIEEDTRKAIKVAKYHEEDDLKPGQGVIAIGNALGYGQSVTVGVISALERSIETSDSDDIYTNLIQTDAAINPGNSGGALLNNQGELIGINVAKLAATEVEGVGYAIPLYEVASVIEELSAARTKVEIPEENQGRLGIYMNTITSSQSTALNIPAGVIIVGFSDEEMEGMEGAALQDSPAREAGLQKNDIITKFDGQGVSDAQELANLVQYYEAGSKVVVTVQRIKDGEYEEKEFTVTLGKKDVVKDDADAGEKTEDSEKPAAKDDKKGSQDGRDSDRPAKPEGGKQGQGSEEPEETEESGNDGSDGQGYSFGGNGDYSDFYEYFRKYLEQYQ